MKKKITRKIHKNRQTRKRNLRRIRTKMWRSRTYKTMKGGLSTIKTLREILTPGFGGTKNIGSDINDALNSIATRLNLKANDKALNPQLEMPSWFKFDESTCISFVKAYEKLITPQKKPIQFLPTTALAAIDNDISTLLNGIGTTYEGLCEEISRNCGNDSSSFKLRGREFKDTLNHVCSGIIHKSVFSKWLPKKDTPYVKLKQSLTKLMITINNEDELPDSHPSFPGWHSKRIPREDPPDFYIDIMETPIIKTFYISLKDFFGYEKLNPNNVKMKCMACMIVMPKHKKIRQGIYGYRSFNITQNIWEWEGLRKTRTILEPNMYCANRVSRRMIETKPMNKSNINRLEYTMTPFIIPDTLLPIVPNTPDDGAKTLAIYKSINTNMVNDMINTFLLALSKAIPEDLNANKEDFNSGKECKFTRIFSQGEIYVYYELKIYKKTLEHGLKDPKRILEVVILDFKVFNEDGICGKEAIFVSYILPEVSNEENPPLPGQPLPGQPLPEHLIIEDLDSYTTQPLLITDDETAKTRIISLFNDKLVALKLNLWFESEKDKEILTLKSESSMPMGRTAEPVAEASEPIKILDSNSPYQGISTIVLTTHGTKFEWGIAKATDKQIPAFKAVQDRIKDPFWNTDIGQKNFEVNNGMEGPDEIKMRVTIKVVNSSNQLQIAEYQAISAPPYLIFATRKGAEDYIKKQMGILVVG